MMRTSDVKFSCDLEWSIVKFSWDIVKFSWDFVRCGEIVRMLRFPLNWWGAMIVRLSSSPVTWWDTWTARLSSLVWHEWNGDMPSSLMCWSDQQECQVFLWLAVIERDEKNFKFLYSLYYIHTLYWCSDRWEFQNCLQLWAKLWDDRNVSNSFLRVCVIDWYGENIQFFNTTLHLRCPMHYKVLVHDAEGGLGLQLYEIELFHKFHTQERKCTLFAFKGAQ